jgi:hypothetical protein
MKENRATAADMALCGNRGKIHPLSIESFTPIAINSAPGIRQDVSAETLALWSTLIKGGCAG